MVTSAFDLIKYYHTLFSHFGPQHWWPGDNAWEICIGAILTQNTSWKNVALTISKLKANNCITPNSITKCHEEQLAELIKSAGYYHQKAKVMLEFASFWLLTGGELIIKQLETSLLRHRLLQIRGIGPETADAMLLYAFNKPIFVIDAYTHRVLQRHNLASDKFNYSELQALFESNLPTDISLYNEYHALIVRVGKEFCHKNKPLCTDCPLQIYLKE